MLPRLPLEYPSDAKTLPLLIHGYVSVKGERSVFQERWSKLPDSVAPFYVDKAHRDATRHDLETEGLTVISESQLGFSVTGPSEAYEAITGGRVQAKEKLMVAEEGCTRYVTHLDIVGPAQPATLGAGRVQSDNLKIDGLFLERPKVYNAVYPSPDPPVVSRFYLRLPDDLSYLFGAHYAHQAGFRGNGVQIAMPDSGYYRHPFFLAHQYNVKEPIAMVPGTEPGKDPVGHGTGESANIFAIAPDAVLQPIRASNNSGDLVAAVGSLLKAKELKPQIITNSWGGDGPYPPVGQPDEIDLAVALEIRDAIDQGILVIFSAGNGQFAVEPQIPGVLSAGGVYFGADYQLQASNYASGYDSPWFSGVRVPSACGLVGMLPRAQYLMLPVPPGSALDVDESQPDLPDDFFGDGTTASDGWALFSGTSAAAPQLAGVAALILGAFPRLNPAQVIEAMIMSAIDVSWGSCHPRFGRLAAIGNDAATGAGLVNAVTAMRYAFTHFSAS
jgi:subtilisin family serine protease